MINLMIKFLLNKSTLNGVALRRAIKDAMPKTKPPGHIPPRPLPKARPMPEVPAEVSSSLKKVA